MYEKIAHWIGESWMVALIPAIGALVAHLKNFEAQNVVRSLRWHSYGYLSRLVYAIFSVFMVGNLLDYYNVPRQIGYVVLAACSVYPHAVITWMLETLKAIADRWKGKQP